MYKKINKIKKKKELQKIKQYYKYIYIFRYNNISNNEIILIKKKLKELKLKSLMLKKTIINKIFFNIKLQGCLFIIYNNDYINLIKIFYIFKKLELLLFINNNNFYSKLKIKNFLLNLNKNFNIVLINPFIYFLKTLKNINI